MCTAASPLPPTLCAFPAFKVSPTPVCESIRTRHRSDSSRRSRNTEPHRLNPFASQRAEYSCADPPSSAADLHWDTGTTWHSPDDAHAHAARSLSRCYSTSSRQPQMRSKGPLITRSAVRANTRSTRYARSRTRPRSSGPRREATSAIARHRTVPREATRSTARGKTMAGMTPTG